MVTSIWRRISGSVDCRFRSCFSRVRRSLTSSMSRCLSPSSELTMSTRVPSARERRSELKPRDRSKSSRESRRLRRNAHQKRSRRRPRKPLRMSLRLLPRSLKRSPRLTFKVGSSSISHAAMPNPNSLKKPSVDTSQTMSLTQSRETRSLKRLSS